MIEGYRKPDSEFWNERPEFNRIIERILKLEHRFVSVSGPKLWSREVWIFLAAEKLQKRITSRIIMEASRHYWEAVNENSFFYPDAELFMNWIKKNRFPLILMTASDSVLKVEEAASFFYDSAYSEGSKRKRLARFFDSSHPIITGDPIDKPDPRFFEKVFNEVYKVSRFSMDEIMVMGDSERNDLEVPRSLGCQTILIQRA